MTALRVVFMGTPHFAVPALEAIIASPHKVVGVYTQPPRPAGRGQKVTKSPIHILAEQHSIPVFTPVSLKSAEAQKELKDLNANIGVVAAYGLLLPQAVLDAPTFGCINIHPSALPRWRGAAPIQRTIMAGDATTACCIMQMDAGLDTGAVLARQSVKLDDSIDAGKLHHVMATMGAQMSVAVIDTFAGMTPPVATPQTEDGTAYAKKLTKEDQRIDWSQPARAIFNQVRGLSPAPGATTEYNGEVLKIFSVQVEPSAGAKPVGTVLDNSLLIQCGNKESIRILELQRPGKTRLPAADVLKSLAIQPDAKLL